MIWFIYVEVACQVTRLSISAQNFFYLVCLFVGSLFVTSEPGLLAAHYLSTTLGLCAYFSEDRIDFTKSH